MEEKKKTVKKSTTKSNAKPKTTAKSTTKASSKGTTKATKATKIVKKTATKTTTTEKVTKEEPKVVEVVATKKQKGMSNESKKLIGILATLVIIIGFIAVFAIENSKKSEKSLNEFSEVFASKEQELIFVGSDTCGYCNLLKPSLEDMAKRYNFKYTYINIDNLNDEDKAKIVADLEIKELGTPYLAITKDSKNIANLDTYADYDKVFEFLQKNAMIKEEAKLSLNYITYEDYKTLLSGSEPSIIVIGQSTCIHCINTKLVLNDIADTEGTVINYLNISYLTEEQGKEFQTSLPYFSSNEWGTPLTLVVKDGALVNSLSGSRSKVDFISFFETNGVLK